MSKYTDNLQKEAEKLAKIQHEAIRQVFPEGSKPFLDEWDKLTEREQYIKTEMQYDAARYVLEARAESAKRAYIVGWMLSDDSQEDGKMAKLHCEAHGYLPTEKEA